MAFKFNVPTLEDLEKEEADVPPVVFIPKKPKLTDSSASNFDQTIWISYQIKPSII